MPGRRKPLSDAELVKRLLRTLSAVRAGRGTERVKLWECAVCSSWTRFPSFPGITLHGRAENQLIPLHCAGCHRDIEERISGLVGRLTRRSRPDNAPDIEEPPSTSKDGDGGPIAL